MQQIWRYRLWNAPRLRTVVGDDVEVVNPGIYNNVSGPDFLAARIRIGGRMWVGSVEMHIRASDWHRHGHDGDPAYENVILHVVGDDDCDIQRADGTTIPVVVMSVEWGFVEAFNNLLHPKSLVLPTCGERLRDIASVIITSWVASLGMERLQRKADDVGQRLATTNGDWLQTVFVTVARGLGFGRNAQPMEQLARSIPIRTLLKHSDSPQIVEALLFGQAGLLRGDNAADDYERTLRRDYDFYATKYSLRPITNPVWHMSSRNGINTPHRRIALLAELVSTHAYQLGSAMGETTDLDAAERLFAARLAPYWTTHSSFGVTVNGRASACPGRQSVDLLIINVLIPILYHRADSVGDYRTMDCAVDMLEHMRAEDNSIVRGFADYDVKARDAFTSQALVQLHREYCEPRRCLDCRLGHRMIAEHITFRQ